MQRYVGIIRHSRLTLCVNEFVVCMHSMRLMEGISEAHLAGPAHSFKPALHACFRKRFFSQLVASPPPPIVPCPLGALLALSDANSASHSSCPLSECLLYGCYLICSVISLSALSRPQPIRQTASEPHTWAQLCLHMIRSQYSSICSIESLLKGRNKKW